MPVIPFKIGNIDTPAITKASYKPRPNRPLTYRIYVYPNDVGVVIDSGDQSLSTVYSGVSIYVPVRSVVQGSNVWFEATGRLVEQNNGTIIQAVIR